MKSILVPLDGSPLAEQGLGFAVPVARAASAKLRLALVHEPAALKSGAIVHLEASLRRAERAYLDRTVEHLKREGLAGVTSVVLTGRPGDELVRHAEERDPDLVVLATHGRGGLERAWLGSVADHLIQNLTVPVVAVHATDPPPAAAPVRRILVALDGSRSAETALDPASKLARVLDAELLVCRVVLPVPLPADPLLPVTVAYDTELTAELEAEAGRYVDRQVRQLVASGFRANGKVLVGGPRIAPTLLRAADEERAGLIAMTTRARGRLRRLGLGSVADKVMRAAPCPVMLTRASRRAS
ncbi:MAG TPA: universal stress protein [Gemmatimonadales bacterium]|nr:universal stress protein [Gemmatimonadales bacterium]